MKNVALCARVSSEQQAQQSTVDNQVAALKKQAETEGHIVLPDDVYIDNGYSGASQL
ncbi:MAG: recombinase family protein [Deltaproteobacteria bacterium]|nr:recombinase family protein [Deltaproteobacteria bacterium]